MEKINEYPALIVNTKKLYENIKTVQNTCAETGIQIAGIFKGFNGIPEAVAQYQKAGCAQIGTSRVEQIMEAKKAGIEGKFMMIRLPMLREAEHLVRWADMSLNSESVVISKLHEECIKQNKRHGIILMADLGDLREGFWNPEELIAEALRIENELPMLDLLGIGTNLGCYGSIQPTYEKLEELCVIARDIEEKIGRKLEIVSGGGSTSYPLVLSKDIPKGINHLRIGEAITIAYDLQAFFGVDDGDLHRDIFSLKCEIVEIKNKPTHPVGQIAVDCYGAKPVYVDRGNRTRAVLAIGRLDYALNDKLFPLDPDVTMIGSSSDHTLVDIEDCKQEWKVGDLMTFSLTYPAVMYLSSSDYVNIIIDE